MTLEPEFKVAMVMAVGFLFVVLGFLMVIMKSAGAINHSLDRIEELISKEVIVTYKRKIMQLRKEKSQVGAEADKQRRQQALLNVPLMNSRKKSTESPKE